MSGVTHRVINTEDHDDIFWFCMTCDGTARYAPPYNIEYGERTITCLACLATIE